MPELQAPATGIAFLLSKTLPQLVQSEIERLIFSGEVRAGERLNEVEIARRLNVSRGPVREALRSLEEAGLVRFEKNRGAAVRVISPVEAMHIYEVRACLEEFACRRLATRIEPGQIAVLAELAPGWTPRRRPGTRPPSIPSTCNSTSCCSSSRTTARRRRCAGAWWAA